MTRPSSIVFGLCVAALSACATTAAPPASDPPATVEVPSAPPAPPASADPPASASVARDPAPAAAPGKRLRATTGMAMDGNVDKDKLVAAIDSQLGPADRCVDLIRKTDTVVGSLNLQVSLAASGAITPELQSPMNPEAKACLLEALKAIRAPGAGQGRAMVLLSLKDQPGP